MKVASIIVLFAAGFAFAAPPAAMDRGKSLQRRGCKGAAHGDNMDKATQNPPAIDREKEREQREICAIPFEKARQRYRDCKDQSCDNGNSTTYADTSRSPCTDSTACMDALRHETERYSSCQSESLHLPQNEASSKCSSTYLDNNLKCLDEWQQQFDKWSPDRVQDCFNGAAYKLNKCVGNEVPGVFSDEFLDGM